jgi:poly(beta-D-mannuronate) lyase
VRLPVRPFASAPRGKLTLLAHGLVGCAVGLASWIGGERGPGAHAAEFLVSSAAQIAAALPSLQPGDTLIMTNGTWTNQQIEFNGFGNAANPITLRAQTPGEVIINGNSTLDISGSWLVVDGLKFEGGALANNSRAIVEFRGDFGQANNSRFTNSVIDGYNPGNINDRYHWVELFGQNNRVDNNYFANQTHSGVTVVVRRDGPSENLHQIDHNHFGARPVGNGNGFETIRIGTSNTSLSDSSTIVENNLFERTGGEIEIISNKSGNNTFRYNTFRDAPGTLTLRHGDGNRVEGNFFLGGNTNNSGAIRVIGERQTIINNYIANVDDRAGGAISISAGVPNSALNQYFQVKEALIAHNTIVNVSGPAITFDDGLGSSSRTLLAEDVTVANNLLVSSGNAIFEGNQGTGWTWEGNLAFGGSLGPVAGNPGVTVADPQLQPGSDGLWRPSATGPAIDNASPGYDALVVDDMDGQPRIGLYDIGADELSAATIARVPLVGTDVGPAWRRTVDPPDPDPTGGCFAGGCAIQAEAYTALSDPNGDGDSWTVQAAPDALDGLTLIAPAGNLMAVPANPHDALAMYEISFSQLGSYTAYYRARGFDTSSDSLYTPSDFGVDPEVTESLSNNGIYRWEKGGAFQITASHLDVPLEFRIGKRERLADFDAFVLHLDASLSDSELEALFAPAFDLADFDEDGDVDYDDLVAWQSGWGLATGAARSQGDADGNGAVDGRDFAIWQQQFLAGSSAAQAASQVPEPASLPGMILLGWALLYCHRLGSPPRRTSREIQSPSFLSHSWRNR